MSILHTGKIALVTGTSSGIGLSTAIQLAHHGFTVIATMRDTTKAGPLVGDQIPPKMANRATFSSCVAL